MFHQSQFPATPCCATISVTASGVSAAKVVATMEVPASHQGRLRPARKKSSVEPLARRRSHHGSARPPTKYSEREVPARRDRATPMAPAKTK